LLDAVDGQKERVGNAQEPMETGYLFA
jgi:hypothetical protein